MKKGVNVSLTVLYIIAVALLVLSFSIALPIVCRFFYYIQIDPLNLPEATGYDHGTIKKAYDEVLDFLMFGGEFKAGVFAFTKEGAAHFYDCKRLFMLDFIVLFFSFAVVVTLKILEKIKIIRLLTVGGHNPSFISAVSLVGVFLVVGVLVALDFESAFVTFHHIFFPGKSNWIFDERYDEIIKILPAQFFLNCAILIFTALTIFCAVIIFLSVRKRNRNLKKNLSAKDF